MKKIVFSLFFLTSCTKHIIAKAELFNCKTLYQPQDLIMSTSKEDAMFLNNVEANMKIFIDRIHQLKEVIECQDKQINLIRK